MGENVLKREHESLGFARRLSTVLHCREAHKTWTLHEPLEMEVDSNGNLPVRGLDRRTSRASGMREEHAVCAVCIGY